MHKWRPTYFQILDTIPPYHIHKLADFAPFVSLLGTPSLCGCHRCLPHLFAYSNRKWHKKNTPLKVSHVLQIWFLQRSKICWIEWKRGLLRVESASITTEWECCHKGACTYDVCKLFGFTDPRPVAYRNQLTLFPLYVFCGPTPCLLPLRKSYVHDPQGEHLLLPDFPCSLEGLLWSRGGMIPLLTELLDCNSSYDVWMV